MKKTMFIVLTVCLIILLLSTSALAAWENPFTDIDGPPDDEWYFAAVMSANHTGIMIGVTPTTFSPDTPASRAMLATILWRLEEKPSYDAPSTFLDLTEDWYRDAVHWASEREIVFGYSPTRFGPNDNLTREQLVTMLYRYAEYNREDISTTLPNLDAFSDGGDVSPWALEAALWAVEDGYVEGVGGGVLNPQGTASRAMLAQILMLYMSDTSQTPV